MTAKFLSRPLLAESDPTITNLSRRRFMQAGGALTLGFMLPMAVAAGSSPVAAPFAPNAFLRIATDHSVTVISKHLEMGQGTYTGLATLVAEELDADWAQVKVEGAPADAKRYNNLLWGPSQGTGGSTAMANCWEQMRRAGATARAMLLAAAAKRWQVAPSELQVMQGVIHHAASGRQARFGELVEAAAREEVPHEVALKNPQDFKLIGKKAGRKDSAAKTNGSAQFTQDIHLPGMLVAVVAHPPRFGAKLKSFDASAARKVKGVVEVVAIPQGVAVLAKDTWSAKKGQDALKVEWDESNAFTLSSADILARYHQLAQTPGLVARQEGDTEAAFAGAAKVIRADYDFPYLAHAAMEPMNCVIQLTAEGAEVWNGEQFQTVDQMMLANALGLKPEQVKLNMLYAGGSFGRRACKDSDYLLEAAAIVKAIQGRAPVKLVWLREDDMRGGYYRPLFHHALAAALDQDGQLIGWTHRLVGQSILMGSPFEAFMVKNGIDAVSVEGASNLPYHIANLKVDLHTPKDIPVPVLWWRSVGSSHTAYSTETFIDEVAVAMGRDPVAVRLELLAKHPRYAQVLRLATEQAGWGQALPSRAGQRRGRGVAVHESFNSYVAQVAEVSVAADGSVTVERIVSGVDCGTPINPDNIRSQIEGGVGFALGAMFQALTLKDGRVEQGNFDGFPALRMPQMPKVEVHILPSSAAPTGIGEPGVPPVLPAVANAIAAATGQRLRNLPFDTRLLAL
jgi:isoquinoline 1-oxidoreductase beta subunit